MSKVSSEDYLNKKLKPIFNALTESVIRENPDDHILFMIEWLKNFSGQGSSDPNIERAELKNLRKEVKKLKLKYDAEERELGVASESENEDQDEEQDKVEAQIELRKEKAKGKGGRSSISAEAYGKFNVKQAFTAKVVPKSKDQIERINEKVLKSFIFNSLDEKDLKTVVDAMEEFTCNSGHEVIKQGDAGSVLYIIEKGTYDCFKTFVRFFLFRKRKMAQ
jgi:hypothetical protein